MSKSTTNSIFANKPVVSLVLSNLVTLIAALALDWDASEIIIIYWAQSVIIGIFNYRRILDLKYFSTEGFKMNGKRPEPTPKTQKSVANFFAMHYGIFCAGHFFFIAHGMVAVKSILFFLSVALCSGIFLFNHWFSYRENRDNDAERVPNIGTIMFFPYARIIPMHIIVIAAGALGIQSAFLLILFITLKTAADVGMHLVEHAQKKAPSAKNTELLTE